LNLVAYILDIIDVCDIPYGREEKNEEILDS
jgi:hypothetical protein